MFIYISAYSRCFSPSALKLRLMIFAVIYMILNVGAAVVEHGPTSLCEKWFKIQIDHTRR